MATKFTFKTEKPTGRWRSFDTPSHYIKLDGKKVGEITELHYRKRKIG